MVKQKKTEVFKSIDVDLIDPPEDVARLEISESAIKELAQSIKEQGQLQPIIVFTKGERFEVVFGHRRWLAKRYLKHKTISAKIVENDPERNALARASENIQRKDISPLEEAMQYQGLIEKYDVTLDKLAKITGVSPGIVKRRLGILKMTDSLIDAIHKKLISQSVGEELMRCPDENYREYLIEMAKDHGVTQMVARKWVDDRLKELRANRDGTVKGGGGQQVYISDPVYIACQGCKEPKEVTNMRSIGVCPECFKIFITMLEDGAFKKGGV